MTGGEEDQKKGEGKGFAGLSSLVSDVDVTPPLAAKKATISSAGTTHGVSRPAPPPAPSKPQAVPQQPYKPPQQPRLGSSTGKWWVGIVVVIGMLWLIGQSNKNTSSPTPAYSPPAQSATPSYSAPPQQSQTRSSSATNAGSDLINDGDGATYRVPSFRLAELDASKRAAKAALQKAREMDVQAERQKILLGDEKRRADEAERQLGALGNELERQRLLVDSSNQYEVDAFNSKISQYNANRIQLRHGINQFNADVNTYNDLVRRAQAKEQQANHMVDIYNSKLEQYGTRQ